MAPYLGYDSDTTFIPGTLNTSSSLYIQGGGITQTGGDVNLDSGTLFIDEDLNRVGIGTTNPSTKLDVDGTVKANILSLSSYAAVGSIVAADPGSSYYGWNNRIGSGLAVVGTTYLDGNVGIGSTSPSSSLSFSNTVGRKIDLWNTSVPYTYSIGIESGELRLSTGTDSIISFYRNGYTGTESVRISSAGNVGIGTTNPGARLHVVPTGSPDAAYFVSNTDSASDGTGQSIRFLVGSGGVSSSGTIWSHYSNNASGVKTYRNAIRLYDTGISFEDSTATRLVIDNSGNVGIGTTDPTQKLHVVGLTTLGGILNNVVTISNDGTYTSGSASGTRLDVLYGGSTIARISNTGTGVRDGWFSLYDEGTPTINIAANASRGGNTYFNNGGNVGIGTTNPAARLDVKSQINLTNSTNASRPALTGTYFGYSPSSYPVIQIGGASAGFNTVSIGYDPSSNANGAFTGDGSEVVFRNGVKFITPNSADTGWHLAMLCMKDGNVGIGTTNPATKLHVRQSADFDGITLTHATRAGIWKIYHSGTASENIAFVQNNGTSDAVSYVAGRDAHTWYTGGTFKMLITSAGSVGVGTDDPLGKLSVSGSTDSRLLNVAEGSTSRFLINGSTASVDAGNAVFYTGAGFDASHYMVLQNNTNSYGRVGLVIRGKTFNGANTPSTNDGWAMGGRSGIRFDAYLAGDAGFDTKFAIQHLLANGTSNSIGDLGILAKGYSTTLPAVMITAAGNVGIGSANPAIKFVVVGSNTVAKIESTTTYVDIQLANSQNSSGYIQYLGGNLRFFASSGSTPTLTITGGSPGRVGIGTTNPSVGFEAALEAYFSAAEPISGGFGARSTGGAEDWNHATNARSGGGWSLLTGTSANGPGNSAYFHPFSFEYASKDGGGNMTQFAIGYNTTVVYFRFRYSNVWSSWAQL